MTYVLFYHPTGEKVGEYNTERRAREDMATNNIGSGYVRLNYRWFQGIETEWCRVGADYGCGPYVITDYERWVIMYKPKESS